MFVRCRWVLAIVVGLLAALPQVGAARADEPVVFDDSPRAMDGASALLDDAWNSSFEQQLEQTRAAKNCDEVKLAVAIVANADFVLSDANLGGAGTGLCLFRDRGADTHFAFLINQRNITDWRAAKGRYQPLLESAGVDPCSVAIWLSTDSSIKRAESLSDSWDAGRPCAPVLFPHGPESEARLEEVRSAVQEAIGRADEIFGWPLTWPVQVHVYDDHQAFVNGVWLDGGNEGASPKSLETARGVAMQIANGMKGFLLDISGFKDEGGLRWLVAHEYFHVVQDAALGGTTNLPFWAVEGGTEYFASLVVGADNRYALDRVREAVNNQLSRRPTALKSLIRRSSGSSSYAAYSRGFMAFRYLASGWGDDTFRSLHRDYLLGNTDRFHAGVTHITGMALDDFDKSLGDWIQEQKDTLPARAPGPGASIEPNSQLAYLAMGRPIGNGNFDPADRFNYADAGAALMIEWRCLDKSLKLELTLIRPDGQKYSTAAGSAGPGCGAMEPTVFGFDLGTPGRTMRAYPGLWRVEVRADKVLQGTATFALDP